MDALRAARSAMLATLLFAPAVCAQEVPEPLPLDTLAGAIPDSLPPQRDIGDLIADLLGRKPVSPEVAVRPRPGLAIVALPSIGYNPAYGVYVGIGASAGGWLGDPEKTRVSVFTLNATYSTSKQLSIQFKSDAWVPGNKWNFKGDWRYLDTSQPTYGLGPTTEQVGKFPMNFIMWRLYETAYYQVGNNIYFGLGYHLNIHDEIVDERAAAGEITPFTLYSGGPVKETKAAGLSANVLIDSRDSPIYSTKGLLWNATLRSYADKLGGDDVWQELQSDFRAYPNVPKGSRHTLAIWSTLWMTFGKAPYLDLPAIGWDTYGKSGRGYVQGRIRAANQIYTEFEYRRVLSADGLWGGVVFANGMTSTATSGQFGKVDPGYGLGLRMKFIKRTRTNLTIDYGWGNKVSKGLYLGTQEVF